MRLGITSDLKSTNCTNSVGRRQARQAPSRTVKPATPWIVLQTSSARFLAGVSPGSIGYCYKRPQASCSDGGCSSVGRAPACGAGCRGFKSRQPPRWLLSVCARLFGLGRQVLAYLVWQAKIILRRYLAPTPHRGQDPLRQPETRCPPAQSNGAPTGSPRVSSTRS